MLVPIAATICHWKTQSLTEQSALSNRLQRTPVDQIDTTTIDYQPLEMQMLLYRIGQEATQATVPFLRWLLLENLSYIWIISQDGHHKIDLHTKWGGFPNWQDWLFLLQSVVEAPAMLSYAPLLHQGERVFPTIPIGSVDCVTITDPLTQRIRPLTTKLVQRLILQLRLELLPLAVHHVGRRLQPAENSELFVCEVEILHSICYSYRGVIRCCANISSIKGSNLEWLRLSFWDHHRLCLSWKYQI